MAEAIGEAGFEGIRKSVKRRQNTVAQYIATRPSMDLCERDTWKMGAKASRRWWEKACIDLEGAKKMAAKVAAVSESESDSESDSNAAPAERRSLGERAGRVERSGVGRRSNPPKKDN